MKPLRTLPKSRIKSAAAVLVTVCYAATNVLWATAPEAAFWSDRRRAARREGPTLLASALPTPLATSGALTDLPRPAVATADIASRLPAEFRERHAGLLAALTPDLGTLRSIAPGASTGPVVVFVQDIHQNDEAQKHIGAAVRALTEAGAVDVVALEGAFGPIDLNRLETHPRPDSVRVVADALLAEHKISGPVHAALGLGPAAPPLIGVDDPAHYRANVEAYRQSIALAEGVRRETRAAEEALAAQKAARLSPALRALDAARAEREDGRLSVGDYVGRLAAAAPDAVPPMTRAFLEALRLEASLDFDRAESERASVLSALAGRLNESEKNRLIEWSVAFRLGKVRHAAYHDFLRALCARRGVDWSRTPTFARYVEYVLKADALDGSALEASIAELERAAFDKNTRTPAEARWMAETRRLAWRRRLTEFALTPRDWAERESLAPVDGTLPDCFASFYREAAARDRAMAENLIRALGERSARRAVLVTGGYHAPGLTEALRRAGATVVSFVPRVARVDAARGSAYLSVFTQEKTPLEKIAAGERLFLAQDPAAGKAEAPFDVAALEESPPSLWALYEGVVPLRSVKFEGGVLRAEFSTGQSVDVRVERTPEGRPRFLQKARRNLREVFWRPLVEIPRTLDALEHRSAFLGFLRDHPVRVFGEESGAVAENLFHQRFRGLSQWIPAGVTLGLGFGLGALLAGFSIGGASLLAGNVASFVLELFFLTLVFGVSGGVGGLYAGHVLYNLFHPRARLALDPPPTPAAERGGYFPRLRRVTLEGGLIPHLRAEFDGNRETAVHLFFDARGKGPFRDRVLQYLRNAFWRPFVEMPWIVRALFSPAAFVDFLGRHSLVVTGGSLSRTVADDSSFRADMAAAVREARGDGPTGGFSPRVGAVLLDGQGRRLARGNNRGEGPHHAEQAALLRLLASRAPPGAADTDLLRLSIWPRVSRRQKTYEYNYREMIDLYLRTAARWGIDWSDVTVVTTLSPCRRCADLMAGLGIKKVVYGEPTPDAESVIARLRARGVGVASCSLGTETRPLMGWVFRIQRRFPSLHAGALNWLGARQWPATFLPVLEAEPPADSRKKDAVTVSAFVAGVFRQRYAGMARWIPSGGGLGILVGAGGAVSLLGTHAAAWAGVGPIFYLLALTGTTVFLLGLGGVLGLYLGHVAFNLFHPGAPLAVEPVPVQFYLTREVREPLEKDPAGLQNALQRLAALLHGYARDVRVGMGTEPSIQWERDGSSLSLRVTPADLGSPAAFERRGRLLADRLKAHLAGPLRGRIAGFPVIHARASDFPAGTLSRFLRDNPGSKITLFQELGGAASDEHLNEIFSRHTGDFPARLFDLRPGASPLSLAAFAADSDRAGWWASLFATNQRIVRDSLRAMDEALASGRWPRVEALLGGNDFSRALTVWLFENYDRVRPVREPIEPDVEFMVWQMSWIQHRPWIEGPWSIRGLPPRAAFEAALERLYQSELLLVKTSVLRNARMAAVLRRMPINPNVQGILIFGAAHYYGLRNDLISWIAPDRDNRPGEGTGAREIAWLGRLPSYRLHRDLVHVLEREFADPTAEDRKPFSPRVQRLADIRPDLRPEWRRALLEKLVVRWLLRARALALQADTESLDDLRAEEVVHRAVEGLDEADLERWLEGAFRDTTETNQAAWNEMNARALSPLMPDELRAQWVRALRIPVAVAPPTITARGLKIQFPAAFTAAAPADRNAMVAFLAERVRAIAGTAVVEEGEPSIQLSRDRTTLRLRVPPKAFGLSADFESAAAPMLDALDATLASVNGGRVVGFPLRHARREDFPTQALNRFLDEGAARRIDLLMEVGSYFNIDFLRSVFLREPEPYARKLFGSDPAGQANPLSLSSFRGDPARAGWFDELLSRHRGALASEYAGIEKAIRERRWEAIAARLGGGAFSEALFTWVYDHPAQSNLSREAVQADVEFMHWQAEWLRSVSWRQGPWAAPADASARNALDLAVRRRTEIQWLEAKGMFLRNARLKAWAAATPIDPDRRTVFPVGALHRAGLGTESFEWIDPPAAGIAGSGTDAGSLGGLLSLPENRLMNGLGERLSSAVAPPSEADLAPFSPWVRSLSDLGLTLTRMEKRWVLELLLTSILNAPRAFGGDPVAAVEEALVQRTVHEATREWTEEAFLSFLEPAFQRAGDGPRAVREAFVARVPARSYPEEMRKAWGGPARAVQDSPERVAEEAQREALALGRIVADRLVELQADAPRTATTKPDGSKVSRADEEAMATLAAGILDAFPTHEIIGEEDLEPIAPELHRRNRANAGSPFQWFVDPLDGTDTYLSGTDIFAVHLELQHEGRPLLAVVVLPRKGPDGGPLAVMARAGRAGLWVNGQWHAPLPPENFPTDFAQMTAVAHGKPAIGEPYPFFQRVRSLFGETVPRVGSSGLWLTGLALRRVGVAVPGLPDNYSYYASQRVKSWDVAAPGFLLENAGGVLEIHDHGRPFFPLRQSYEDKEAKFSVLAALTPEGAAAWRRAVLETSSGGGDRAGPAAAPIALPRLERIHPERVAALQLQIAFFDLDGTLWRSTPYDVKALRWAQFFYGEGNVTPERFSALREFFVEHDRGDLKAQIAALDAWAAERNVGRHVGVVDGHEKAQNIEAETRRVRARPDLQTPGVRALLESLATSGIPLEVVTSGSEDTSQKTLGGLELASLFRRVHPGGDKENAVVERLKELGLTAVGAVLIGNDARDMKAARAAGALAVGIAVDEEHAAPLRAAGADAVVHGDFTDLASLRELLGLNRPPARSSGRAVSGISRVEIVRPDRVAAANLRLCFFDINGTLWRGYPFQIKAELWSRFLYNDAHPAPERVDEVRRFFIDTDWMSWGEQEKALAAWARERDLAPVHSPAGRERSEEIRKIVNKELVGLATPEQVLPGTRALLELLRESGVRLEVATSGSAETRNRVLRGLGLSGFFGTLHGGGKKGDVIGRRLAEEGMAGANAALIGDGRGDIAAARATGALAVGVASDEERAAVLRAAGADVLVHGDFADLPALLSALGFGGRREAPPWRVEPAEGDVRTLSPPADRGLAFPPTLRFENVLGNYKATVSETPADGPYLRSVALQKLPLISEQTGFEVFLSNQGLQRTGSFKPWILSGVLGRVAKDPEAFGRAHRFLTTPTTGNQGQSLAFFAEFLRRSYPRELGHLRAVVFVPRNAPPGKIDRMRAGGAEIRFTEDYAEAETRSREFAEREGAYFLAHGDERAVESYGALGLDLLTNIARREDPDVGLDQLVRWFDLKARSGSLNSSEAGELSALDTALSGIENTAFLIPVGAGGVVAGVDFALKSIDSRLTVIGVDSSRADPMAQSLARGEIVSQSPAPDILENGIAVNAPEPLAFQTAAGLLDAMVTVPFESVAGAVRAHWEEAGVVSEGAAALPYAALAQSKALVERLRRRGVRRVVLLGTGQNIPADAWTALTGASGFPEGPRGGGMHHAGEADLNSDQWKAVRARVRREATFEERRRWAADLRARVAHQRDWLDPLELTEPLLALADLLDQKKPTARGPLASLGVQPKASAARWYLLGPVAGEWSDRIEGAGERVPGRGRSPEEVRLYVTGLAAVIHEGLEHAVLPETLGLNPKDRHTLAYLAEALANSWNDGPVPERTLEEMGHRRAVQLVGFVERSRAEIHQIRRRYSDRPALRERLESIVHRLRAHAELCLADLRAYPKPNAFFTAFRLADEAYWTGTVAEFGRSVRQLDRLTRQAAKEVQRPLPLWRTVAARFRARNAPWAAGPAARPPTDAVPNDFRAVRRSWDHFEFPEFSTALTRLAEHARQRPLEGGARDLFRLWAAVDQVIEPLRRRGDWRETETLMVEFADWVRAEAIVRGVGSPYWEKTALHLLRDLSLTVFEFHRLSAEEAREFGWAYELLDRVGREATPPALSLSDQRHLLAVLAGGATTPLERGVLYEKARAALPRFKGSFREKLEDVTLRAPRFNVPRGRPSPTEFLMGASWNSEFSDGDLTGLVRDYLSGEVSRPRLERLLAAGGDTPLSQIALALDQWDDALHPMPAGSGRLNARELSRWTARAAVGGAAAVFFVSTLGAVSGVPVDFRWIAPLLAPALLLGALAPLARPRFDPAQKPGRLSQFLSNARADPAAAFLEVVDGELRINPGALNRLSQWPVPVQNAILYGLGVVGHESLHRGGVGSEAAAYGVAQLLPALLGAGIVAALLGGASLAAAIASLGGAPLAAAATGMMLERWADGRLRDRRAESAAAALCAVRSGGLSPVDFKSLLSPRAMNLGVGGGPVTGHRLDGADDPVFAAGLKAALAKRGVAGPPEEIQSWLVRALRSSPDFAAADPVASASGDRPLTVVLVSRSVAARLEAVVRRAMADRAEGPATELALIPLDAEGEAAVAQWNPLDRRVERWVQRPTRGSDRDPWDLSQVESLIRTRLNPASFTSCRVVAAADVPLRATGLATPLFREALVWLMEGLLPLSIETAELDRLTRLSRLVATSA